MSEEPEQVLPQDCAAVCSVVDVATQQAVVQHAQCSSEQQREDHQRDDRGDEHGPGERWHTEHRHAWRTHGEHGGQHVDRGCDGTDTGCAHTDDPQVRGYGWGVRCVSKRHVHGPAEVSRTTRGQEPSQHREHANGGNPESECVQTWERHIRRADLQRQDIVSEAPHNWRTERKQHHGAVHGKQLVELLVGQELQARAEQLSTDQQSHQATNEEPDEGHDDVHDAQLFVVCRGELLINLRANPAIASWLRTCRLDFCLQPWRHSGHSFLLTVTFAHKTGTRKLIVIPHHLK